MADGVTPQSPCRGVSRADFALLIDRALIETEASLRGDPSRDHSTQPVTAEDWWEILTEVVMPALMLEARRHS